jgi:hypothetical protein
MFSVNPCYDLQPAGEDVEQLWSDDAYAEMLTNMDPDRQRLYETCQRQGVGITVMKAFGGGDLLNAELSPAGVALTAHQCIAYALSRPAVCVVLAIIVYCFGCNFKAETTTDSVPMRVITCDSIPSWDSNSENKISSHVTYRITVTDDSNKYDSLTFDVSKKVFDKYNVNDTIIVEVESKYRPLFESSKVKYKISDAG